MRKENFIQKTDAFIETGSYLGDGIQLAINSGFSEIYSIELGDHLYQHCQRTFPLDNPFLAFSLRLDPTLQAY